MLVTQVCECLPWHLSRVKSDQQENYKICQNHEVVCAKKAAPALEVVTTNVTRAEIILLESDLKLPNLEKIAQSCNCPDPCQGALSFKVEHRIQRSCSGNSSTRIRFELDFLNSIRYRRRVTLIWELMLGSVGGLFAIFSGISFLFVIEVLYFFTVRWLDNSRDPILRGNKERFPGPGEKDVEWSQGVEGLRRAASDTDLVLAGMLINHKHLCDKEGTKQLGA